MGKQIKDLSGQIIGRWKVIKYNGYHNDKAGHKRHSWLCECQCLYKTTKNVLHSALISGHSNSCIKCVNKKYNTYDLSGEYGIGYTVKGEEFYFDLEDYNIIKNYCWHKHKDGYLRTRIDVGDNGKNIYQLQHILIFGEEECCEIDHINRKPHDNRKENLRFVTHINNMKNYGTYKNNTSGVMGVNYSENEGNWKAYIQFNNKKYFLGSYKNIQEAIIARLSKEKELYKSINKKPPQYNLIQKYNII